MFGQLQWNYKVDVNHAPPPQYKHHLEGLTYTFPKGEWTAEAPEVYKNRPIYTGSKEIDINQSAQTQAFLYDQPYSNNSVVVIPYTAGLLVLDAKTGKQKLWIEDELEKGYLRPSMRGRYWFDDGKYTITCGKDTEQSDLVYEAGFLKKYKKYLLHFNGKELFILKAKDGTLLSRVPLEKQWGEKARVYAVARWKKLIINWDGIIYR